ncbi:hypothetical protein JMJ77_0002422, partial [Colletotrichum scovillei]
MCQSDAAMWAVELEKIAKQSPSQDVAFWPVCHVPGFACHSSTRPHQSHQQPHRMLVYVTLPITGYSCLPPGFITSPPGPEPSSPGDPSGGMRHNGLPIDLQSFFDRFTVCVPRSW